MYISLRKQTTSLASRKKKDYYTKLVEDATNKSKSVFTIMNLLTGVNKEVSLPTASTNLELTRKFQSFFKDKIQKIRESFTPSVIVLGTPTNANLNEFDETTEEELREIIKTHGIKCSPSDPVPAKLLSSLLDLFIPIWKDLVNLSLSTGSMDCLKSAILTPILKELDDMVNTEIYKNYRPISNLVFVSKLVERCVSIRLKRHMNTNNLECDDAYGYKEGHSAELLLMNLVDKILRGFDNKYASVLLLLDLSAAFDTVDQDLLLSILSNDIGIHGTALKWFSSFIKDRTVEVKINDSYSGTDTLDFGVPQGSVLGPTLFGIYIRSLYQHT